MNAESNISMNSFKLVSCCNKLPILHCNIDLQFLKNGYDELLEWFLSFLENLELILIILDDIIVLNDSDPAIDINFKNKIIKIKPFLIFLKKERLHIQFDYRIKYEGYYQIEFILNKDIGNKSLRMEFLIFLDSQFESINSRVNFYIDPVDNEDSPNLINVSLDEHFDTTIAEHNPFCYRSCLYDSFEYDIKINNIKLDYNENGDDDFVTISRDCLKQLYCFVSNHNIETILNLFYKKDNIKSTISLNNNVTQNNF